MISPFNFPMALAGGPAGGGARGREHGRAQAVSRRARSPRLKLYECLRDAGLPDGVVHLLPGGDEVGQALVAHPGVDGLTFTGSYAVGMSIYRHFADGLPQAGHLRDGRQEPHDRLGQADLDMAADGVARSAFGLSGPEVLRLLAGLRAARRLRGLRREARRASRARWSSATRRGATCSSAR